MTPEPIKVIIELDGYYWRALAIAVSNSSDDISLSYHDLGRIYEPEECLPHLGPVLITEMIESGLITVYEFKSNLEVFNRNVDQLVEIYNE